MMDIEEDREDNDNNKNNLNNDDKEEVNMGSPEHKKSFYLFKFIFY